MRTTRTIRCMYVGLLTAGLLTVGGCGKKMAVRLYPEFYSPEIQQLAVADFRAQAGSQRVGGAFARQVADALRENGTYTVISITGLDPEVLAADTPAAAAREIARVVRERSPEADTVLFGQVLADVRSVSGYGRGGGYYRPRLTFGIGTGWHSVGRGFGTGIGTGWGYDPWYDDYYYDRSYRYDRREARVTTVSFLARASDGEILHGTPGAVTVWYADEGVYRGATRRQLLNNALAAAAQRLAAEYAPAREEVTVQPGEVLRTAQGRENGRWDLTDEFGAGAETLYVLIELPAEAARNAFRVAIARNGRSTPLAERTLTWPADVGDDHVEVLEFDLDDLRNQGGTGEYDVRFYGPLEDDPVFTREIELQ